MKAQKKEKPFIDYKTARVMARMYDFIVNANYERKKNYEGIRQGNNKSATSKRIA